jgi:hypothetical protein
LLTLKELALMLRADAWKISWRKGVVKKTQVAVCCCARLSSVSRLLARGTTPGRVAQELQNELGLEHLEGRGWRGFHHHATLCIASYGFLVSERSLFPLFRLMQQNGSKQFFLTRQKIL